MSDVTSEQVGAAFRRGVETDDLEAALAVISPDVVFHSPVVHKPYEGIEALRVILTAVNQVFEDFRYTAEFSSPDGHVLKFACRVGDRELEGVDMLHIGADGKVDDFTVMVRPYSAATELRSRMAALLAGS
jgi:hypothetical protein